MPDLEHDIIPFSPIEHTRKRPGMYIGGIDKRALHQLVEFLIEDAVTSLQAGLGNRISITLHQNNQFTIQDNTDGIPIAVDEKSGKPALEVIMTRSGIDRGTDGLYLIRNHSFGILLRAVNALSSELRVQVARDGYLWQQTYQAGVPQTEVIQVRPLEPDEATGTTITFTPDFTILERSEFDYQLLCDRAQELAAMVKGATITVRDERLSSPIECSFRFEHGFAGWLEHMTADAQPLHTPVYGRREIDIPRTYRGEHRVVIDFAFQYTASSDSQLLSYANRIRTSSGTHVDGFLAGIRQILERYDDANQSLTDEKLTLGLNAIISVFHPDPQFESQFDIRLMNSDVAEVVAKAAAEAFSQFAEERPHVMQRILDRILRQV